MVESQIRMSVHRYRLELTEPAIADFRDILSFTLQIWGELQFSEYKRKIDGALIIVAENPHSGCKKHGLLVFQIGRHQIFYRLQGDVVYILRILHDRMDVVRHLPEN